MNVSGNKTSYFVHFFAEGREGQTFKITAFERSILAAYPSIEHDNVAKKLLTSPMLKIVLGKTTSFTPLILWTPGGRSELANCVT